MARATVALLFSDIEGSTRLLQSLGPSYADVLLKHHRLMRSAFSVHDGTERGNEGDSFFVTFPTASDAVGAALDAQLALRTHRWPGPDTSVRVRMGVHVGDIDEIAGALVGIAVHETARIAAAANGSQVLVSQLASQLATALPPQASWLDLGEHQLKDIAEPVHLRQLMHPDIESNFPPIRTQGAVRHRLPAQATSFVGRRAETAAVHDMVRTSRLVTLTGPGGSGKTRIALTAAAQAVSEFASGPWFVDLASVSDPVTVPAQVAAAVGLSGRSMDEVCEVMASQRVLLVVDNCEHLIDAASDAVRQLLSRCADVTVIATSREPLGLPGEVVWRVPPLSTDDAAALLGERAHAANSQFVVTPDNRATVDEVCRRLDAIPLALELAAARLGSLSVDQLADRLDQRFRLLAGGVRGGLERHRTLQATVDWSYELLAVDEQQLLRRLGVFVGGFTLDAVEALCPDLDSLTVLDLIDALVRKSLVIAEQRSGGARYRLLETVRQYALEKLASADELVGTRDAHLTWAYAGMLESGPVLWFGGDEVSALDKLDNEEANLRAAFEWALDRGNLHIAASLLFEWFGWFTARGRARDGFQLVQWLLASGLTGVDLALAAVLEMSFASNFGALQPAMIARVKETAPMLVHSSYAWVQPIGDAYAAAWSYPPGDKTAAATAVSECERIIANAGDVQPAIRCWLLQPLMWTNLDAGNLRAARDAADQAVAVAEVAGLSYGESRMTLNRARIELQLHDIDAAWADAERAARIARHTGEAFVAAAATRVLAQVAEMRGDVELARDLLASILDTVVETHSVADAATVRADLERLTALAA